MIDVTLPESASGAKRRGTRRSRWAAIGAAIAVTLGAGGITVSQASISSGDRPVFVPITPCRLVDTRPGPAIGSRTTPLGPGESLTLKVTGSTGNCSGIPADAVAAAMNVTSIAGSERSFLSVYPANVGLPTVSNLNWNGGDPPTPNKVDVKLSPSGEVKMTNAFGTVHIAADLAGYYIGHDHDDRYYTKSQVDSLVGGGSAGGYARVLVVAESGGDFTSVAAAVDAIGTDSQYPAPSSSSRYLVKVAPGVYEDERVTMKDWVDIEGSGQQSTIITDVGGGAAIEPGSATLVGAANAELRNITVENVSAGSADWAFAIYTSEGTTFSKVTAIASGGANPRGVMVHDGALPVLRDVAMLVSDGTSATTGLDVYLADVVADGIFVSSTASTGLTYGVYVNNSGEARIENSRVVVSGTANNSYGMLCVTSTAVEFTGVDVDIDTSGSSRGVLTQNCELELRSGTIDATGPSTAVGIEHGHDQSELKLEISDLDIEVESTAGQARGIWLKSTAAADLTTGSIRNVEIDTIGSNAGGPSRGIWSTAAGAVLVDDVAINVGGTANFLYGIHVQEGSHEFTDVDIRVDGSALTAVGMEITGAAKDVRVDRGTVVANNPTVGRDAVGLKSTVSGTRFSDITVDAFANGTGSAPSDRAGIWAVDVIGGSTTTMSGVDATATATGTATNYTGRAVRCVNSTLTVMNSRLVATYETVGGFMTRWALDADDCLLEVGGSDVRTEKSGGAGAALRVDASSNPGGPAEVIVRGSRLMSTGNGMLLSGDADVAVFDSDIGSVSYADAATATCTGVSRSTPGGAPFGFTTNGACP